MEFLNGKCTPHSEFHHHVTRLMEFLNGECTPHSDEVESWDAVASKNRQCNRIKLYDGGGAQYGENCISQKRALQRNMQLPS